MLPLLAEVEGGIDLSLSGDALLIIAAVVVALAVLGFWVRRR